MSILDAILIGGDEAVARFNQFPGRLRAELKIGVGRAALLVLTRSKEKLSDDVLHVRTGRLRRSVNMKLMETDTAVQGSVGTNVSYARVHEFGFHGIVTVREHLSTSVLGKKFSVREHQRRMEVPEKSFLRSALAEMADPVRSEFEAAAQRALT